MRNRHLFLFTIAWASYLFILAFTGAHAQPPADTEKLQNIRKLIMLLGGPDMQEPRLSKDVDEKDLQGLIEKLVPVYEKHLTDEEVSELLKFYESPTGKKAAQAMPQISEESRRIVLEWRQSLAKKVMDKQSELVSAVTAGDTARVKELLSKGADVNERNSRGVTPLIAAAYKRNTEVAKLLVEKGADVNATTRKGITPLMAAVEARNRELVKFLLDHGADANMKEETGLNAYQLAAMKNQHELMKLLKDRTTDTKPARPGLVVSSPDKGKDCLYVMSLPSDSSHKITCLKLGQEVAAIPGVPTNSGWTLIQHPKLGWVRSESLKQTLVRREQRKKKDEQPKETIGSRIPVEMQPATETPTLEPTPGLKATEGPRIWWRR
ncbi:MAG: ankyrin repeat domain-containing protein [Desulfomonilaceae bacterium]